MECKHKGFKECKHFDGNECRNPDRVNEDCMEDKK